MNTPPASQYDVLIIGGGLAGCSLALALAEQPLTVALLEARELSPLNPKTSATPDRALALSYASCQVFQTLGLGAEIAARAQPISQVHVSDAGHFGSLHFQAEDLRVPALGQVIFASQLLTILQAQVVRQENLHCLSSTRITALTRTETGYQIDVHSPQGQQSLTTRLLVVADGSDSKTRELLGITAEKVDYGEQAVFGTVSPALPHQGRAYERFTSSGPLALLPLPADRSAFVWTLSPAKAQEYLQLEDQEFCARLQQAFGYRLGRLSQVADRQLHKLHSVFANEQIRPGLVLLGNAAHTLHPVAAQGFNLSLKDAAALAQIIISAQTQGKSPGDLTVLTEYQYWRTREQKALRWFTEGLIALFGKRIFPVALLRDLGLCGLDMLPSTKRWIAKGGMGMLGRLPKLVCGIK